jgi:hypothetical protein
MDIKIFVINKKNLMNIEVTDSASKTYTDIIMFYINNANVEATYALLRDCEINLEIPNKVGMTPLHV